MTRTFTVEAVLQSDKKLKMHGGRYVSETPSGAARKAFSQAYRQLRQAGSPPSRFSLEIHLRETTRESKHKVYKYRVSKVNQSVEFVLNGETVIRNYVTKVKSLA